ncbi:hypothetical protein [Streptosporangium sp. NPDC004631]
MSGLVQRLLARSRAPVSGVRPRPASLFEHHPPVTRAPAEPPVLDTPAPAPARRPPGVPDGQALRRAVARDTAHPVDEPYREGDFSARRLPHGHGDGRVPAPVAPGSGAPDPATAVGLPPAERPPTPPVQGPAPAPPSPPPLLPFLARTAEARRGSPPLLRVAAGPVLAAPASAPRAPDVPDTSPPAVVEISIGRLEVRTPPAQAAPQPKPSRKDHVSVLETYLRRRGKGELT